MKLSVNEVKLTGLCSRNCYSTGFEFKQFALGPEKFLELSRNEPQALLMSMRYPTSMLS